MFESASLPQGVAPKRIALYAAIVVAGGAVGGYAIHEHHAAQSLVTENAQATAALSATRQQLNDLAAKVNSLAARAEAPAAPAAPAAQAVPAAGHAGSAHRPSAAHREDPRYKKLQSQLDAQGKAIEDTRNQLASTQGDLSSAKTELSGSIAHTHDELVLLQKKGERNFAEFDISKSKEFRREGPVSLRLKKANDKHQFADLELMVDDRNLSQKHVNLYQPLMFYTPDSPQAVEIVINSISKDHIHGYVSAPKYRQSELATMASTGDGGAQGQGTANSSDQPTPRKKLPLPQPQE
jgi:hypothetical protein